MRKLLLVATLGALGVATPQALAGSLPSVATGARPGPDILYEPPAKAPQLENAAPWNADPILVSGSYAYRDGEYLYQDFLYDDHGATGSPDPNNPLGALGGNFDLKKQIELFADAITSATYQGAEDVDGESLDH